MLIIDMNMRIANILNFRMMFACVMIVTALLPGKASGQYYDIGTDAASVRWNSVSSKNFQVIYPRDKSSEKSGYRRASRYLDLMENHYGIHSDSVLFNYGLSRRFPLILHSYNAASNGVTVWAPRQIDLFGIPSPDILYPQNWDEQLALHEGRHAWQIAHFNRGFFKVMYWFFGDQFIGGASGIYPSRWLLEGDAVVAETEMSNTGRGRSGEFINSIIRATRNRGGRKLTWDRLRLGSVKHYELNPYSLGYAINSMARRNSGDYSLTHKILNYEPMHFMSANVLASAFENYSGKSHREYVSERGLAEFADLNTNRKLEDLLQSVRQNETAADTEEKDAATFKAPPRFGAEHGYYTEFSSIAEVGKDSVAAIVKGYGSTPFIVLLTKEGELLKSKALHPAGASVSRISSDGNRIFWSEVTGDIRWGGKAGSTIFTMDIRRGKVQKLDLQGENLYRPVVYGNNLYTIEYKADTEGSFINRYDLAQALHGSAENIRPDDVIVCDGQVTEIAAGDNAVYFTSVEREGLALYRISCDYDNTEALPERILGPSFSTIRELSSSGRELFFITDYFGGQRLCRFSPADGRVAAASYGDDIKSYCANSYNGHPLKKAYISEFKDSEGAFIRKERLLDIAVDSSFRFEYPLARELSRQYAAELRKLDGNRTAALEITGDAAVGELDAAYPHLSAKYEEKRYRKGLNLFRIHSWAPAYADISGASSANTEEIYGEGKAGATLYSQNSLGSARAMVGYSYEHTGYNGKDLHGAHAKFTYSGWYPVLEAGAHFNDETMYDTGKRSFRAYASASVPLQFNRGGWMRGITPQIMWDYRNDEEIIVPAEETPGYYRLSQTKRSRITGALGAYSTLPVPKAGVFPRLGIGGVVMAGFTPDGGENFGNIYSGRIYGYVPGIGFNHSVRLSAGYQFQDVGNHKYWLDNLLALPRGYTKDIYGKHYIKACVDYAVPIYLGDVSWGGFAYFKRLDIVPFFDYGRMQQIEFVQDSGEVNDIPATRTKWNDISSFGADMIIRAHFFRIGFPASVGVRYARRKDIHNASGNSVYDSNDYFGLILGFTFR